MILPKLSICIWALIVLIASCNSNTKKSSSLKEYSLAKGDSTDNNIADIECIDGTTFNFGNIKAGDTVIHAFHFKNIGKNPLIISSAIVTCGCTIAQYNKKPIPPNHTDSIVALFISNKETRGFQNKVVTVNYNSTQSPKLLTLYGKVN